MFIVIDLVDTLVHNQSYPEKRMAKVYIRSHAALTGQSFDFYRIYDTERHVTIKLVPKKKVVWEAYVYNTELGVYRGQLFTTLEGGQRWCEAQGAFATQWRTNRTTGRVTQRIKPKSFGVKPREVR